MEYSFTITYKTGEFENGITIADNEKEAIQNILTLSQATEVSFVDLKYVIPQYNRIYHGQLIDYILS